MQDPFAINELTMDQIDTGSFHDEYGFGPELQELLGELNNVDKDIILLRFGCGYSHAEIARAVGKSEVAVRKRLERATLKLRAILIDREVE